MEWVKPKALLEAIARGNGSVSGVIDAVCKRAALGVLRAKARHLVQDGDASTDAAIPKQMWTGGTRGLQANWAVGDFSATVPLDLPSGRHVRVQALGVTFCKADAVDMGAVFDLAQAVPNNQPPTAKGNSGNKLNKEAWSNFGAALAYIANTEGLDSFTSRAKVYSKVCGYLALRGIAEPDEGSFRDMIDLAGAWINEGDQSG